MEIGKIVRVIRIFTNKYSWFILIIGLITQSIWFLLVPWSWGWDSAVYLAVGQMYLHNAHEMWSLKYYISPGYPLFLVLSGVHGMDTTYIMRVITLLFGSVLPYLIYRMVCPFDRCTAIISSLIFACFFGNAVFSTDIMSNHLSMLAVMFASISALKFISRPTIGNAVLAGCVIALSGSIRHSNGYLILALLITVVILAFLDKKSVWLLAKSSMIMCIVFFALVGAMSVGRYAVIGGQPGPGLTRDYAARMTFFGSYYLASIFSKQYFPDDDPVLVREENGPASQKLVAGMRSFLEDLTDEQLETYTGHANGDKSAALIDIMNEPTFSKTYQFWFWLDNRYGIDQAEIVFRNTVIETAIAQPRIFKYYAFNFLTYLFGPTMYWADNCSPCVDGPFFLSNRLQYGRDANFDQSVFNSVIGPNVRLEMKYEADRAAFWRPYGSFISSWADILFQVKPILTFMLIISPFFLRGKRRAISIYCSLAVLLFAGTTSLAFPGQVRYWYPALPFVIIGSSLLTIDVIRKCLKSVRHM